MASQRALFTSFLASSSALRTAVFSESLRNRMTRSLTTIPSCRTRAHKYTGSSIPTPTYCIHKTRRSVHASAVSFDSTPPSVPSPSVTLDGHQPRDTHQPRPPSRIRRVCFTSSLVVVFFFAGFAMAAAPIVDAVNGFINPPTDAETLELFEPSTQTALEINEYIINHPLSQKLSQQDGMVESRPHMKIPPAMRPHNLTGGTLLGEDKIEVPPLTFSEKEAELPTLVQISYLGPALCGHPGIIHGGLLATMLDEGLARACFPALPNKVGVTASLKIDYRVPCPGSSYVVLRAQTTKVEGRKAWVKGWIELLGEEDGDGTRVVEAEALFIEPKQAKQMARVYSTT